MLCGLVRGRLMQLCTAGVPVGAQQRVGVPTRLPAGSRRRDDRLPVGAARLPAPQPPAGLAAARRQAGRVVGSLRQAGGCHHHHAAAAPGRGRCCQRAALTLTAAKEETVAQGSGASQLGRTPGRTACRGGSGYSRRRNNPPLSAMLM